MVAADLRAVDVHAVNAVSGVFEAVAVYIIAVTVFHINAVIHAADDVPDDSVVMGVEQIDAVSPIRQLAAVRPVTACPTNAGIENLMTTAVPDDDSVDAV